jgi:hypothetical protein
MDLSTFPTLLDQAQQRALIQDWIVTNVLPPEAERESAD